VTPGGNGERVGVSVGDVLGRVVGSNVGLCDGLGVGS